MPIWRECLEYSDNADLQVATTDWLYMTLRRDGQHEAAARLLESVPADLEVIEDEGYRQRLRLYRGEVSVEDLFTTDVDDDGLTLVTQGYGIANWYYYNGDPARAAGVWQQIRGTAVWAAFGYIAAEADAYRVR